MFGLKTILLTATAALAGIASAAPSFGGSALAVREKTHCDCNSLSEVFHQLELDIHASVDAVVHADIDVLGLLDVNVCVEAVAKITVAIDVAIEDIKIIILHPHGCDFESITVFVKAVLDVFVALFIAVKAIVSVKLLGILDIHAKVTLVIVAKIQLFLEVLFEIALKIDSHCNREAFKKAIYDCARQSNYGGQIREFLSLKIELVISIWVNLLGLSISL